MSVASISPDYEKYAPIRYKSTDYGGNILVYVHWEEHLSFCAALTFPLPPAMPWAALVEQVIAPHYAAHPQAAKIDWSKVRWMIDGKDVAVTFDASLADNGVRHKSVIRFWTPGLAGQGDIGTC